MVRVHPPPDVTGIDVSSDLDDPAIRAKVDEFNGRYLHWDEARYRTDDDVALHAWAVMKHIRELSAIDIDLCGMGCRFCMIPRFTETLRFIDRDAYGRVGPHISGEREAKAYLIDTLMEESIASSQIEGAATTRVDAKRMLCSGRAPRDHDERMILNNYAAMDKLKSVAGEELTPDLIRSMHRTIVSGTLRDGEGWEGRYRESDDIVVGDPLNTDVVYHVPPSHTDVPTLIEMLCRFANNNDGPYIHPIVKAIIIHYAIGYIHPFVDGNGRLARSLFYWFAMRNGYWLLEYTSLSTVIRRSKGRYGLAYQYTETDDNDLTYFIRYNLECIVEAIEGLIEHMERRSKGQSEVLDALGRDSGMNILDANIIRDLTEDPCVFSLEEIKNRYGVSYQTARVHVLRLVDTGHLKVMGRNRKKVLYALNDGMSRI